MESTARITLAAILTLLAAIHLYWAAGGRWGLDAVIPTLPGGKEPLFRPGRGATIAVALLLLTGAAVSMGRLLPGSQSLLLRLLAAGFAIRAAGDFRYAGFFKRVRETRFAYWDTRLFSPLCAGLSLLALAGSGL